MVSKPSGTIAAQPKPSETKTKPLIKRRRRSLPWTAAGDMAIAKKYYGGCFPTVKGRKYIYPPPSAEAAWMSLIRDAVRYDKARSAAVEARTTVPVCPDPRLLYILFHACPKEIKRRATRNKHRKQHGLAVGDEREVHHNDPIKMAFKSTVVLTPCQHKKKHGKVCAEEQAEKKARAKKKE